MRLCSQLLLAALLVLAAPACYPHRGAPRDAGAQELLELAQQACRRRDPTAQQMLLSRLARRHPDTAEGQQARQLLDAPHEDGPPCPEVGRAAEARD